MGELVVFVASVWALMRAALWLGDVVAGAVLRIRGIQA